MNSVDIQDISRLIEDGSRLSTTGGQFSQEIAKIYNYVSELEQEWSGQAAEKYTTNINSFKEEFEEFAKLVNNFGELINAIGNDYKNLEENL